MESQILLFTLIAVHVNKRSASQKIPALGWNSTVIIYRQESDTKPCTEPE